MDGVGCVCSLSFCLTVCGRTLNTLLMCGRHSSIGQYSPNNSTSDFFKNHKIQIFASIEVLALSSFWQSCELPLLARQRLNSDSDEANNTSFLNA